jgi:hypothetical protein
MAIFDESSHLAELRPESVEQLPKVISESHDRRRSGDLPLAVFGS